MVKKPILTLVPVIILTACATVSTPPPNLYDLYIDALPQSVTVQLSLNDRIKAEEAWNALRQGDLSHAEKALVKLGAPHPIARTGMAYIQLLKKDVNAAMEGFRSVLTDFPDSILARIGLAQVFSKTGEEELLFNELQEILKNNPAHPWAKTEYETLKIKKTEEALAEASQAQAEGQSDKAKEAFLKALYYTPEQITAHLSLAEIYKKEKKWSNALVHIEAAATVEPRNVRIQQNIAETLSLAEQYSKSLDAYEKILELDPKNTQAKEQIDLLKDKLGIYDLPSQFEKIAEKPAVIREDMAALLIVRLRDVLGDTTAKPPIIVDISASWASRFIVKTASLGLMEVYPNHSFQPQNPVTRAEMAEILSRAVTYFEKKGRRLIRQISTERIQIADVPPEHTYFQPIIDILSYQVMDLSPEKTFRPDQTLSGKDALKSLDILLALVR